MKKIIYRILFVVCLAVFLFSAWQLFQIWQGSQQIKNETDKLSEYVTAETPASTDDNGSGQAGSVKTLSVDWEALKAQNPDIIAWIDIPGTGISYPVVQGTDNDYYLNVTAMKEYNTRGAIFLDAQASPEFTDDNSIIYGHSVDVGGMFTELKDFSDPSFFDSHPYFWLLTPAGNYRCDIIAFTKGNGSSAVYTSSFGDYRDTVVSSIMEQAQESRPIPEGLEEAPMVSLSTCDLDYGFNSEQRLILTAVLQPWTEPIPAD